MWSQHKVSGRRPGLRPLPSSPRHMAQLERPIGHTGRRPRPRQAAELQGPPLPFLPTPPGPPSWLSTLTSASPACKHVGMHTCMHNNAHTIEHVRIVQSTHPAPPAGSDGKKAPSVTAAQARALRSPPPSPALLEARFPKRVSGTGMQAQTGRKCSICGAWPRLPSCGQQVRDPEESLEESRPKHCPALPRGCRFQLSVELLPRGP